MDFSIYVESGKLLSLARVLDRKMDALSAHSTPSEIESIQFLMMVLVEQAESLFNRADELDARLRAQQCGGTGEPAGTE